MGKVKNIACLILLLLTFASLFSLKTYSQTYNVSGKITTDGTPPVKYALVTFVDQSDTLKKFSAVTDTSGNYHLSIITDIKKDNPLIPETVELAQNYPNPFLTETTISYKLKKESDVTVRIYDILAQEVRSFRRGLELTGKYGIRWDGRNNFGYKVTPGIYFYQLVTDNEMQVKKMIFGLSGGITGTANSFSGSLKTEYFEKVANIKEGIYRVYIENTDSTYPRIREWWFNNTEIQNDTTLDFVVCTNPSMGCPIDFRATDVEPAWSPDGITIAYVHGDTAEGKTGIYLIETDGNNKRLWYSGAGVGSPSWSPDGQWIVFHDNAQIYKQKLNGDSLTQLTSEGRNFFPDWSPDGEWITYSKSICEGMNTCGVWLMKSSGLQNRFLVAYGNYPNWNPLEMSVLYVTRAVTHNGEVIGDSLWLFNIQSNKKNFLLFLSKNHNNNLYPKYSPDGMKIAFTSTSHEVLPPDYEWYQIWVMNADGTNPERLTTTQGYTCDWSPDGEWIVYTDSRAVSGMLWIMRKDGSYKRQLTFD